MPDRDVFNRNVERGWQAASRELFLSDGEGQAVPKLMRGISGCLKHGGCPGIDAVAAVVVTAMRSADPRAMRGEAVVELRRIAMRCGNTLTDIAITVARQLLENPEAAFPVPADRNDMDRVKAVVAERTLVEIARAKACSGGLLQVLVGHKDVAGANRDKLIERRDHALSSLAASPKLARLAQQLLLDPRGGRVTSPRMDAPKPSLEELLHFAVAD